MKAALTYALPGGYRFELQNWRYLKTDPLQYRVVVFDPNGALVFNEGPTLVSTRAEGRYSAVQAARAHTANNLAESDGAPGTILTIV